MYDKVSVMYRPEQRLLLACVRVCTESERRDLISCCLNEPIDWQYLIQIAHTHTMTSQLFHHLDSNHRNAIPENIYGKLHNHFLKQSLSSLLFTAELIKILDLFNQNHIPAIPFKGPTMAQALYDNPALREFGDLDFLVESHNIFKALRILGARGYRETPEYLPAAESWILRELNHYQIRKAHGLGLVELHWSMVPAYFILPLPIQAWWKRAEYVSFEGTSILNLSAEDMLAILCIHGCKHLWPIVSWFSDIARILDRRNDLNWDYILSEYRHPDLRRMIYIGLIAARNLANAKIPAVILRAAEKDSTASRMARDIQTRIFRRGRNREDWRFLAFHLGLKTRWMDRIAFGCRIIIAPKLCSTRMALPRFLTPLYHLFHK
jgi:hypothetical protein